MTCLNGMCVCVYVCMYEFESGVDAGRFWPLFIALGLLVLLVLSCMLLVHFNFFRVAGISRSEEPMEQILKEAFITGESWYVVFMSSGFEYE
jgi:hypothetical protein